MKLQDLLTVLKPQELNEVLQWYGLKPLKQQHKDNAELIELAASKIVSNLGVLFALNKFSLHERRILTFIAASGGECIDVDIIQDVMQGNRQLYESAMHNLKQSALISENETELIQYEWKIVSIPQDVLPLIHIPFVLKGTLSSYLIRLPVGRLQEMCRQLTIATRAQHRAYLIKKIRQQILDASYLRRYLDELPKEEASIFQFIADIGGRATTAFLDNQFSLSYHYKKGLRRLLDRPILISDQFEKRGNELIITSVRIPRDVLTVIRNRFYTSYRLPDVRESELTDFPHIPEARLLPMPNLNRDLLIVLGFILRHRPTVLKNGSMEQRHIKKINSLFDNHDSAYSTFIRSLAEMGELIKSGTKLWSLGHNCQAFLNRPLAFRMSLIDGWLHTTTQATIDDELQDEHAVVDKPQDIPESRHMILETMSEISHGDWLPVSFLRDLILRRFSTFKKFMEIGDEIEQVRTFRKIIEQPLHWLGLIELGEKEPDQEAPESENRFFRITALGRFFLFGWLHDSVPSLQDHVAHNVSETQNQFLDHERIQVSDQYPPSLLLNLLSFTDVEKVSPHLLLKVNPDSIRNGFDIGLRYEQMKSILAGSDESLSIPESMDSLLIECKKRYGELTVGVAGGYITAKNKTLLNQLLADKRYQPFISRTISPTNAILLSNTEIEKIVDTLRRDGYMPIVENEEISSTATDIVNVHMTHFQVVFLEQLLNVIKKSSEKNEFPEITNLLEDISHACSLIIREYNIRLADQFEPELLEKMIKICKNVAVNQE